MQTGITQKKYLELSPPSEEDARSSQMRIMKPVRH